MKRFDPTKPKYTHLFKVVAILTTFLIDAKCTSHLPNLINHGWDKDFYSTLLSAHQCHVHGYILLTPQTQCINVQVHELWTY
jgi:hypothetical protein